MLAFRWSESAPTISTATAAPAGALVPSTAMRIATPTDGSWGVDGVLAKEDLSGRLIDGRDIGERAVDVDTDPEGAIHRPTAGGNGAIQSCARWLGSSGRDTR
jgi:hypothetical protein